MDVNNSAYPSQSERIGVNLVTETVEFNREPPPPYSTVPLPVVTTQPIVHESVHSLKRVKPIFYHCSKCGTKVLTKVEYTNTSKTHLFAGFICGLTCWCLLCCLAAIPYLVTTCKKANHYCPQCNTFFGAYSRV